MSDWDEFVGEVTSFAPADAAVDLTGEPGPWDRGPLPDLPALSRLLADATVTSVSVSGRAYELLAWGPSGGRRGWLCLPPVVAPASSFAPAHRSFLAVCGGIVERFGEPSSWWLNQDEVLTEEAAATDLAPILDEYSWLWDDEGLEVPTDLGDHYVVAVEANGNLTLVHRETSRLLLFAPDHSFEGVTPLPGCPEYSLMTVDEVPDLGTWIEAAAAAWSAP